MSGLTRWTWLILLGSIWGLSEVFGGELLYSIGVPHASIWLAVAALLMLTVGRGVFDRIGTSLLLGTIAALFKVVTAAPHYCHLLAIVALGLVFDIAATASGRLELRDWQRATGVAAVSALGGAAVFGLLARYAFGFPQWIEGGAGMLARHVLVSGGAAATLAACLAPVAFRLGARASASLDDGPRLAFVLSSAGIAGIWMLAIAG